MNFSPFFYSLFYLLFQVRARVCAYLWQGGRAMGVDAQLLLLLLVMETWSVRRLRRVT
jgi:hypothetical protein